MPGWRRRSRTNCAKPGAGRVAQMNWSTSSEVRGPLTTGPKALSHMDVVQVAGVGASDFLGVVGILNSEEFLLCIPVGVQMAVFTEAHRFRAGGAEYGADGSRNNLVGLVEILRLAGLLHHWTAEASLLDLRVNEPRSGGYVLAAPNPPEELPIGATVDDVEIG